MTPDQRELAEWVARWAGDDGLDPPARLWPVWSEAVAAHLRSTRLAWQAEDELIELIDSPNPMVEAAYVVESIMCDHNCTRAEATFRALRAAKGGE